MPFHTPLAIQPRLTQAVRLIIIATSNQVLLVNFSYILHFLIKQSSDYYTFSECLCIIALCCNNWIILFKVQWQILEFWKGVFHWQQIPDVARSQMQGSGVHCTFIINKIKCDHIQENPVSTHNYKYQFYLFKLLYFGKKKHILQV